MRRLLTVLFILSAIGLFASDWKGDTKKDLLNKEVMLRADVFKIRFKDSLGFGLGTGHDVTNFDKSGFYYKSGVYRDDNAEELSNRINAKGVEVFKAGSLVTLYEIDIEDDNVKIKFKTTGDKGAVTFHYDKSEGKDGFFNLYKQVFVFDNRREILAAHPDWPAEVLNAINKGEVLVGMDEDQVQATLGPPARTRKSTNADGTFVKWDYALSTKSLQISFLDGKVHEVEELEGQ